MLEEALTPSQEKISVALEKSKLRRQSVFSRASFAPASAFCLARRAYGCLFREKLFTR